MKQNKKYKKEVKINIKDFFKEINDKRELIKDFKNKYINAKKYSINKNKCEIVTLRISSLNKLLNEFERVISISLDIISSLQNNKIKNENIKIKLKKINEINNSNESKENKENIFKKINEQREQTNYNNNYCHFLNNNNTSQSLNSELIKKNKRLLFNKSYTLEANKNNSTHNNNIINFNNELKVSTHNNNNNYNNNNSSNNNNINISLQTDYNSYSHNLSIINPINYIRNNNAINSNSQNVTNYSNIVRYPQNYIRNNFPLLKERTLTTLYNPEYSKYFSMQKSQNIIDVNNNKNSQFSQVDLTNHNYNNYTFEQKDNKYSQKSLEIKSKSPLRKALRTLIQGNKLSQRSYDYSTKVNKDDILNKIKDSEKCKKYFSEKYGEGSYFTFLNKYKIGKLDRMQIKNELKIISNILEINENEKSLSHSKKRNSAINKSNLDDTRNILSDSRAEIGIRKKYFFKKFNSDSNRSKSRKSENENNNDNIHKKIKYSKIEELIKSFEEKMK